MSESWTGEKGMIFNNAANDSLGDGMGCNTSKSVSSGMMKLFSSSFTKHVSMGEFSMSSLFSPTKITSLEREETGDKLGGGAMRQLEGVGLLAEQSSRKFIDD